MSCTSCLSNNDIKTPDQVSVPCTTPYFHKDTLTPPSSLRSRSLMEADLAHMRPAMQRYITHTLYFEVYIPLSFEGIQLMSIAGYEAFVCVCFLYKPLCAALYMAAVGRLYIVTCNYVCLKLWCEKLFHTYILNTKRSYQKINEKH